MVRCIVYCCLQGRFDVLYAAFRGRKSWRWEVRMGMGTEGLAKGLVFGVWCLVFGVRGLEFEVRGLGGLGWDDVVPSLRRKKNGREARRR